MNQYSLTLVILLVSILAVVIAVRRASLRESCHESERTLTRILVKSHSGMIAVSDAEGRFLATSKSFDLRFQGAPTENGRPGSVYDILDEASRHGYGNMVKYVFRNAEPVRDFRVATAANGPSRELLLTVTPVLTARGRRFALINEFASPNKLTGMVADYEHLEKLTNVGQIAAGIAHGLNTPLGAIILSADIIAEMDRSTQWQDEARKIKSQASHCSRIVKELLRYVKKDERIKRRCSMRTIIARVRSLVESELGERHITLAVNVNTDEDTILCDENQMEQLLFNLFSNSFHAIREGGRIEITASHDALLNQLVVMFDDNGGGIDPRNIDRIFDPFFTTKPGSEGTGLGLALCKRIIHDHHGRIEARSVPGKGTTFIFRIPVA